MNVGVRKMSDGKKRAIVGVLFLIPFWIWAVFFVSGFARWPNSPIREVRGHYVDKRGHEYSAEQFDAFHHWETSPYVQYGGLIPVALGIGASLVLGLPLRSRDSSSQSTQTSDQFRRFFPVFMVGVAAVAFLISMWWMFAR